jgi:RIMS-binding protein 2
MSPNPDACEEELPFSEGDTIKVSIIIPPFFSFLY